MATINELISSIEVEKQAAEKRAASATQEMKAILAVASQEGRSNLTEAEADRIEELEAKKSRAKADLEGVSSKLATALRVQADEAESEQDAKTVTRTEARKPAYDEVVRVGQEERTYRPDSDHGGRQFLLDVARQQLFNDVEASTRLARHMQEERVERGQQMQRATGTSNFTGLVVPQYLTGMYAPYARSMRPFADACTSHDLGDSGMTVEISKITTGSSAAIQATQNSAVDETNMDDTLLSIPVLTAAGQQTVSRQAVERGTGIEDITMQDLFAAVATNLDSTLINRASTGLTNVATSVAYTDVDPTVEEVYPKFAEAASGVEGVMKNVGGNADLALMHSRRWHWINSQLSANHPLINQGAPGNAAGNALGNGYNAGIRGTFAGLNVITDQNVPTDAGAGTEDEIYIVSSRECHLWEDSSAPVFIRAEQTNAATLGVLFVAYQYFAFTHNRFSGGQHKIAGTGLIAPTFA